ncbi:hypothetical protein [Thermomonas sp.]|uniref:hypothetical protein n=1 Tax=Thermomonas sp. TaxID=1971895 RepID=UPI0035B22D2D
MSKPLQWGRPDTLSTYVEVGWQIEVEPFDASVVTCFGQVMSIMDESGEWAESLSFEHIGYSAFKLKWRHAFHPNPFVEWIFRSCLIDRVQTHVDVRPIFDLVKLLPKIEVGSGETVVAPAIARWTLSIARNAELHGQPHLAVGARVLSQWAADLMLPGFAEEAIDCRSYIKRGGDDLSSVTFLDPDSGPFSSSELRRIENAIVERGSSVRQRTLFFLCRDWGLRPIQLALLREEDFGTDDLGPYLMVPGVKGIRRSRQRRSKTNFKKRYISDEAAAAVVAQIESNKFYYQRLIPWMAADTGESESALSRLPRPLFPSRKATFRAHCYLSDSALRPYTFHCSSPILSREMRDLTNVLRLPLEQAGEMEPHRLLQISAYRLRHTKATAMVMSGHAPIEVAEALDHMTVSSVRYYFDFSLELIGFVNASHRSSAEINEAVATWGGRVTSRDVPIQEHEMRVAHLGVCKAIAPCPHHPTVTCYTCPKFRPFKEADHAVAEKAIRSLKSSMVSDSTGPVRSQVDAALEGVLAVQKAIADAQY